MDRLKFIPPAEQRTFDIGGVEETTQAKSVLILEDETDFAVALKEYLESYNFSVTIARDGVEGLKRIMERDFDVIVCDLLMPNLPGDMFYLGVERVKPHLAKRFIFITGHQSNPKISDFLKRVRPLTLYKPFELHVLHETILAGLKARAKTT